MRGLVVATLACGAVLASAGPACAQTTSEPPAAAAPVVDEPVYPPPSASWKVVAAGLGTTAVAYGAAAGLSYAFPDAPGAHDLRIPVAGPWMAIANNGCREDEPDCSKVIVVARTLITAVDGLAQAGGIALAIQGLFMRTQVPRAPSTAPSAPTPSPSSAPPGDDKGKNLFFLPMPMTVGTHGVGIGVSGRF